MTIANIIIMIIWLVALIGYGCLAVKSERSRRYYEKQAQKAIEVLELIGKIWSEAKEDRNDRA